MADQMFGSSLGGNPLKADFWELLRSKIAKRLDRWKKVFLSKGGCLTLIQSVLSSLPISFLLLFQIPCGVAAEFDILMQNYMGGL